MNQELKSLLTIYENKMASMWQLDGEINYCEDESQYFSMFRRMRILDGEVKQARENLVAKIEELTCAA